jgi:predicted amidophosphoribosyltransferase
MTDPKIIEQTLPSNPRSCSECRWDLDSHEDEICDACIEVASENCDYNNDDGS